MKLRILLVFVTIAFAAVANLEGAANPYTKTDPALPEEVMTPAAFVDAWQILSFSMGVANNAQIGPGQQRDGLRLKPPSVEEACGIIDRILQMLPAGPGDRRALRPRDATNQR